MADPPVSANRNSVMATIKAHAKANGIPDHLLWVPLTIAYGESGFNPRAVGDNGEAIGIYQLHARGKGAGKTVAWREDVANNVSTAMPEIASEVKKLSAQGLSGYNLLETTWYNAQRPEDSERVRSHMRTAYNVAQGQNWGLMDDGGGSGGSGGQAGSHPQFESEGGSGTTDPGKDFVWPDPADYHGNYAEYLNVIGTIAATFALGGLALPPGLEGDVKAYAQAAYNAAKEENGPEGREPLTPEQAELYRAQAGEIAQRIAINDILLPYDIAQIQAETTSTVLGNVRESATLPLDLEEQRKRIDLMDPFGSEAVLRSGAGQKGFRDYWATRKQDTDMLSNPDYLAGYRLAETSDQPRYDAIASYLDRVVQEIGDNITMRGQDIQAATEEMRGKIDMFRAGDQAFQGALANSIPTGSEFIPGFEPEGLATSLGLKPIEANPIPYDPFEMSLDILNSTPAPTSFERPATMGLMDNPEAFEQALEFFRSQI